MAATGIDPPAGVQPIRGLFKQKHLVAPEARNKTVKSDRLWEQQAPRKT